ncbi:hypothetical protein N657DRAFT_718103 [Parathielavia appendiculata]|uniref:Uncharacterized protein n=1 Tax=Parathielavia appendiculata TaxID=2587402 RepID=A0AAN6TYC6_9PEZI|nr:hypothetical protein N657DRAFT_718103 [Parathielavia appendiculata]
MEEALGAMLAGHPDSMQQDEEVNAPELPQAEPNYLAAGFNNYGLYSPAGSIRPFDDINDSAANCPNIVFQPTYQPARSFGEHRTHLTNFMDPTLKDSRMEITNSAGFDAPLDGRFPERTIAMPAVGDDAFLLAHF